MTTHRPILTLFMTWIALAALVAEARADDRGFVAPEAMKSERRVALVIGNSAYQDAPLKNPANDARVMAQTLRALGFTVHAHENLGQKAMRRAVIAFGRELREGGVGLFYFAGHGIQVRGRNYLIPVDAVIEGEADVEIEAVDTGAVLAKMANAQNRLNIVILDACRNNPFGRSWRSADKGLAFTTAPNGTLIAYATAPGSVAADGAGRNGTYTEALVRHMRRPGMKVEEMFKRVRVDVKTATRDRQVPWEYSSLVGDFYFTLGDAPPRCPVGTRLEAGRCVAILDTTCPAGMRFVQGRGCVAVTPTPTNTRPNAPGGAVGDRDGDGILDQNDTCPTMAEDKDGFEDSDGCPDADNDGDRVADTHDQCPNEPETRNGYQDLDGCPDEVKTKDTRVVVTDTRIEITDKIYFDTSKATIKPASYSLLDAVAATLKGNPRLAVRIEGHTDSKGSGKYNKRLSEQRAQAVRAYLIQRGVAGSRLEAVGYGEEQPIAPNSSAAGRSKNNRVEFFVVQR